MAITRTLFEGTTQPASAASVSTGSISVEPGDLLVAFSSFTEIGTTLFATLSDNGASTPAWTNVETAIADAMVGTSGVLTVTAAESIVVTMTTALTVDNPRLVVVRLRPSSSEMEYISRVVIGQPNTGSNGIANAGTVTTSADEFAIAFNRQQDSWITVTATGTMVAVSDSTSHVHIFERNGSGSSTETFDNGLGGGRFVFALYEAAIAPPPGPVLSAPGVNDITATSVRPKVTLTY